MKTMNINEQKKKLLFIFYFKIGNFSMGYNINYYINIIKISETTKIYSNFVFI